jgi:hypothetical protein
MAVEVVDLVPSLKREVQPPGVELYPGVSDADWVGHLTDAFGEARLDGFLEGYTVVEMSPGDAEIQPLSGPDAITLQNFRHELAVVVLYAGIRVLRNRILNMNTGFRAKAGAVEFEQQNSATMLAEMLKQLRATKERILDSIDEGDATAVTMIDAYSTRVFNPISYHGGIELTG